ncbi:hypothetical protein D3C76_358500 [compost metagenome]
MPASSARVLQEVQSGLPSLFVHASLYGYGPLVRIDGKPGQEDIQYFHTNLAELPEQLTDEQGHTLGDQVSALNVGFMERLQSSRFVKSIKPCSFNLSASV